MKDQVNNENKNSIHWKSFFTGVAAALLLGAFYQFLINPCKGIDCKKIIAAIPAKYQNEKSAYILRSVEMNARLQGQLDAFKDNSRISDSDQKALSDTPKNGSKAETQKISNNVNNSKAIAADCCTYLSEGVKYDLRTIILSTLAGQGNHDNVSALTLDGYGVYIEFYCYPETKPDYFEQVPEITNDIYNSDYKLRQTARLKYTLTNNSTPPTDQYLYDIRRNRELIMNNIGMICPAHCPIY